jgi:hypothetical protein
MIAPETSDPSVSACTRGASTGATVAAGRGRPTLGSTRSGAPRRTLAPRTASGSSVRGGAGSSPCGASAGAGAPTMLSSATNTAPAVASAAVPIACSGGRGS